MTDPSPDTINFFTTLALLFIGCIGGFLAGLLGVGGGIIFIPVIGYFLGDYSLNSDELVRYTLANSIALVFLSGVSGTFQQRKMGTWNLKLLLQIGIPGALASWATTRLIQEGTWYNKTQFLSIFLGMILLSFVNMVLGKPKSPAQIPNKQSSIPKTDSITQKIVQPMVGLLAGVLVALSGLGGGIVMVPLFNGVLKKPLHTATALSLSIVPLLSIASLIHYLSNKPIQALPLYQSGYLVWPILLPMMLGVLFCSSFGQKIAKLVPEQRLRLIFASLLLCIFIKVLIDLNS